MLDEDGDSRFIYILLLEEKENECMQLKKNTTALRRDSGSDRSAAGLFWKP